MAREPSGRIIFEELIDCVNAALDHLDFFELMILRYYVMDGLKLTDISQRLNISPSRARSLLAQGLNKLREQIGSRFSDEDIGSILESL